MIIDIGDEKIDEFTVVGGDKIRLNIDKNIYDRWYVCYVARMWISSD